MNTDKAPTGAVTAYVWSGGGQDFEIPAYSYCAAKPAKALFGRASSLYVRRCPETLAPVLASAEFGGVAGADGPAWPLVAASL